MFEERNGHAPSLWTATNWHKLFTKTPRRWLFWNQGTDGCYHYQTFELAETSATKIGTSHDSAQHIQKPPRHSSFWRQRLQNFVLSLHTSSPALLDSWLNSCCCKHKTPNMLKYFPTSTILNNRLLIAYHHLKLSTLPCPLSYALALTWTRDNVGLHCVQLTLLPKLHSVISMWCMWRGGFLA